MTFEMSQEDADLIGRVLERMKTRYTKEFKGPEVCIDDMEQCLRSSYSTGRSGYMYDLNYDYTKDYDEHLIELAALCILAIKEEEGVRHQLQLDREGE